MFFSRISTKVTLWFAAFFLVGALILFALTGYLLHSSLKRKDQDLLEAKFQDYSALLARDGVQGLQFRTSKKEIPDAGKFLVRYQSSSGQTLLLHVPETLEAVGQALPLQALEDRLKAGAQEGPWLLIRGGEYGDDVEVLSRPVQSGGLLQIGMDTEDREEHFEQFARSFFLGLLPVLVIAVVLGGALAGRVLAPVRWLTQTIQEVRSGKTGARVLVSGSGDELDRLGTLFNQLQAQNERLILGMRETLDHVAHDLRTPVMRLQNSSQRALERAASSEVGTPLYESLADCQENSEVIQKMLNAIMDVSEAETGTMSLQKETVEASALISGVVDLYGFVAEEKKIHLEATTGPEVRLVGDRVRLLQAIANLVDNAIKYSPEGSRINVAARQDGSQAVIEVTDQGPGVPTEDLPKIWDRLYRGDQSRSTRGLGLGLSVVRAIAQAHGGQALAENLPQGGCLFRLVLPAAIGA